MFSLMELETTDPNHLWLRIPSEMQERAWEKAQYHSNPVAQYNAYVNLVCLDTFMSWLGDWLQEESVPPPSLWPGEDDLASILEVVNGTAIQIGNNRLVLIPSETLDLEEFCVPQEWVDISSWAADYYLAVEVNLDADEEESWIRVVGFATHHQLKNEGRCNESDPPDGMLGDRTYSLPVEQLTENLDVMRVSLGIHWQTKVALQPIISEAEAQTLLRTLGDSSIYSPRLQLDIPFATWAALLENDRWRQQLYNRRLGNLQHDILSFESVTPSRIQVNLSQWFDNIFERGWQSLDTIICTNIGNLAFNIRSYSAFERAPVKGVKIIDLGMQIEGNSVAMLVALTQEAEQKTGVLIQVHPTGSERYLPPNLKVILSESGEVLQEVESRSRDYYIQLNRFKGLIGTRFSIQMYLGDVSITEEFVV